MNGLRVLLHEPDVLHQALRRWDRESSEGWNRSLSRHPDWLAVLEHGLRHVPYCLEAIEDGRTVGLLPLAYVASRLFGRFLVSLPYLNTGGVMATDPRAAEALIDEGIQLAERLQVRYLELRHEKPIEHPALQHTLTTKVHMRLRLPASEDELWKRFKPKVRNQVRKGEKSGIQIAWGSGELLDEFYAVFSRNMRDLGTPVFGRRLFFSILSRFPEKAEICVARLNGQPVAVALLLHGHRVTEVPSASSLRAFNSTNANMLMYWQLLCRAIRRGQEVFDFGRSTPDGGTCRFKRQWGAQPEPAAWQYYLREGAIEDMRVESGKYDRLIRAWQRLPLPVTRWLGPLIVRGIP